MEIQTYPSLNELTAFAHNKDYLWFCCKWLGKEQSWSNTMWGYTSLELNRSCRVVGKLEAAVTLGVRI